MVVALYIYHVDDVDDEVFTFSSSNYAWTGLVHVYQLILFKAFLYGLCGYLVSYL